MPGPAVRYPGWTPPPFRTTVSLVRQGKIGRYELLHKIAAGGMAEIFLARQWGQGGFFRDAVIKRLFPHYAEHEHALRMFQDEARLLAELSHPNIPQAFDLGYADGYWYLAMEHVGGWSLADLCRAAGRANKPLPQGAAIGIVGQVCQALHHAHERPDREGNALRIVHRDVTPQNIMITTDAVVKMLDFGVAQTAARVDTDAGAVRGTYSYMAPEQVRGKPLDKRADVFAVGIILYELTTGRRLFRGSDVEIMTQVVEEEVPPPSKFIADYPDDLERIVMGALERDRSKRSASAAHVGRSLDQFCLRYGLLSGPLVVAQYVRSVFPYERAHEAGMGISEEGGGSEVELEQKAFADEMRSIGGSSREEELRQMLDEDIEELSPDELLFDDEGIEPLPQIGEQDIPEHMGLDRFDDDADVKPVVLLSPKRKARDGSSAGDFMSDLERRLAEDSDRSEG